ncbi:MAG: enoyl-CoA hydratase/isomerase family protein [Solirubrobacterales bacterium]|nr:enoyl-CoA hydratase/isomerase family protein [Solirubrobacterales bacterium]
MSLVSIEYRGEIAVVTLEAPQSRNALSRRLLSELRGALAVIAGREVGAIVLSGSGPAFSAGADIGELTGTVDDVAMDDAVAATVNALRSCPLPVVAAIEGPCMGAAVDLVLACDVRIVSEDGFFAVPAVALGILYSPEALERMAGRVGHQTLARLLLLGERIGGEEAVRAGLAARAVPAGETLAAALALSERAAGRVPEAGAATKAVLDALATDHFYPHEWQELRLQLLASEVRAKRISAAKDRLEKSS